MPPAPPAAPQNEDWNNVSHINGSIVPVGERNQYLYSLQEEQPAVEPDRVDVRLLPGRRLARAVAEHRREPQISGWSTEHGNESGYQIAPTLQVYFKRTFSGPFLEGGLVIASRRATTATAYDCYDCSTHRRRRSDWVGPEVHVRLGVDVRLGPQHRRPRSAPRSEHGLAARTSTRATTPSRSATSASATRSKPRQRSLQTRRRSRGSSGPLAANLFGQHRLDLAAHRARSRGPPCPAAAPCAARCSTSPRRSGRPGTAARRARAPSASVFTPPPTGA